MISKIRLLLAAAIALVALAAVASTASGAAFSDSPAGAVNAVSEGKTTFSNERATIACRLTLALRLLAGPIEKVAGRKIGEVTSVTWAECEGGNVRAVLNTPWEVQYSSIAGTLPEGVTSTSLVLKNTQFQFSQFFGLINCLYAGDAGSILTLNHRTGATYTTGSLRADETTSQSYVSGPTECPARGHMSGTFNLSTTQTLTRS